MEKDQANLELSNISPELTLQGTDVAFEFPTIDKVYKMPRKYQANSSVSTPDYVDVPRRLPSRIVR